MNKNNLQHIINANLRLFDTSYNRTLNIVRFNVGSTKTHEMKKAEICYNLQKEGRTFICEGRMKNGMRPDVCVLDTQIPIAYEIMCSESEESIQTKTTTYGDIKIIPVRLETKL
jgi:hypothetical protein